MIILSKFNVQCHVATINFMHSLYTRDILWFIMCIIIILCLYLQCVCINFVTYIILFCVFPLTKCSMILTDFLATHVPCMYFEFFLRVDVDQSNNYFHDHDYESCYTLGNVRLDSMHIPEWWPRNIISQITHTGSDFCTYNNSCRSLSTCYNSVMHS